jgi:hypothetical protein
VADRLASRRGLCGKPPALDAHQEQGNGYDRDKNTDFLNATHGAARVRSFLERLAVRDKVSASTQNQALNPLVMLFRKGLSKELGELGELAPAKRPKRMTFNTQSKMLAARSEATGPNYALHDLFNF